MDSETQPISPWTLYKEHVTVSSPPQRLQPSLKTPPQSHLLPRFKHKLCPFPQKKSLQTIMEKHTIKSKRETHHSRRQKGGKRGEVKSKSSVRGHLQLELEGSLPFEKEQREFEEKWWELMMLKSIGSELKGEECSRQLMRVAMGGVPTSKAAESNRGIRQYTRNTQSVASVIHKQRGCDMVELLARHKTNHTKTTPLQQLLFKHAK